MNNRGDDNDKDGKTPKIGALAERELLLAEAERITRTGSWLWEPAHRRVLWSDQFYRNLGLQPGSVAPSAEAFYARVHPDDLETVKHWQGQAVSTGRIENTSYRVVWPTGDLHILQGAGVVSRDREGNITRFVGTIRDVTEQVELEERLHQAAKMEAVGTLAAGIAHDFNNYLMVIMAELSALDPLNASEYTQAIAQMNHAIEQAGTLTRQLLAFARKSPASMRVLNLLSTVDQVAIMLQHMLGSTHPLTVERPTDHPIWLQADAAGLEQVLLNLAINARDAMPDGGPIKIQVTTESMGENSGDGAAPTEWVVIRVTDRGTGIPPALFGKIFEPYFSTKNADRGTGLGLASAYGIVTNHGGTLSVENLQPHGACFIVRLPRCFPSDAATALLSTADTGPIDLSVQTPIRVLVVDDLIEVRNATAMLLRAAGYQTIEAADGPTALKIVRDEGVPDVILIDLAMPVMSGPQLAERLIAEGVTAPVIFMTGYATHHLHNEIGDWALLLEKPFGLHQVVKAIQTAMKAAKR